MKKVFYSVYSKIIIGILCVLCIVGAATTGLNGIKKWEDYKTQVYRFEDQFEDSAFLSQMLNSASFDIYNAIVQYVEDKEFDVKANIEENIDRNYMSYYLVIDGEEFSNASNKKQDHEYYYKLVIGKQGIEKQTMCPDTNYYYIEDTDLVKGHTTEIYIGLEEDYIETCSTLWKEQKLLIQNTVTSVVGWIFVSVVCFLYLILVIGKDENGNKISHTIDKLFVEFNLLLNAGIFLCGFIAIQFIIESYYCRGFMYELTKLFVQITAGIVLSISLVLVLSLIRNMKNKTFFSRCFIFICIRKIKKLVGNFIKEIGELASNFMSLIAVGILFVYTAIIGILGVNAYYDGFYCLVGVALFIAFGYVVLKYFNSLNRIKKGVDKIRDGELDFKIDEVKFKDLRKLKDGINDISDGLQASVDKTLKAEKMKTELITNVSHDLKTPLTSIINYTTLLSNVENLPEEAKDYIAIIDKKSLRLKTLTQDLFDISKAQSGNDEIIMEKLNVETLLNQSLAEYEKELSSWTVCLKIEDGLYIHSDGRKMSRVINNLLINIIKYAMPNTRVFIDAYSRNQKTIIEMKNISSYPLDFDKEEIMQRFKRGDESRTEEGNGLGLAIVKSYVEVTGGKFDIVLDGDLFKAIIEYDKK